MASVAVDGEKKKATYGKVILTLQNCIIPQEKLSPTPSEIDGLDREIETELRILGCELIQTSGILLRLPQVAMATGQVLFQRFYYSKSFVRHTMEAVAAACITLASKIEEAPRRIRDVLNVVHHIKQVRMGKTIQPLILDQNYINLKNQVIKAERRILKELGFCVHVQHPHKNNAIPASVTLAPDPKHCQFLLCHLRTAVIWLPESLFWQRHLHDISENNDLTTIILNLSQIIVTLLKVLNVNNIKLTQTAWNYMNDSLRSEVFVLYCPETIACACIYLSARVLQIPLPNKPAWYLIFNVTEEDIHKICLHILSLYSNKKPDSDKLEKIVAEVNKIHQEAKLKAKGLASMNALLANHHSSFSPTSTPVSPKDSKSPNSDAKKDKFESKNNGISPKGSRDNNHRKRRSVSPNADGMNSPHRKKKSKISSSGGSLSSRSPSPRRKNQKTPPRGFKDSHRSRSRSKTRELKKSKRKSSHKVKKENRSLSISPSSSPHKHSSNKKSYKSKSSKSRHASRSPARNHEHNHHTNSHEKSHKSRNREKNKSSHHSKDKSRR